MSGFQDIQRQFTEHLRNPAKNPAIPGLEDRRLKIYRELFFNNIVNFLESGFPVLRSLYRQEAWLTLARAFFSSHACRSPYFVDISKEFVEYLSNDYHLLATDPPFIQELAHYEWLELALSIRIQEEQTIPWDGAEMADAVVFSELAELVSYQYPVHQISPEFQPSTPSEPVTYLVVNRDDKDEVQFTEINAVTAHLLHTVIQHDRLTTEALVEQMCTALPHVPTEQVSSGAMTTISQMLQKQILLPAPTMDEV